MTKREPYDQDFTFLAHTGRIVWYSEAAAEERERWAPGRYLDEPDKSEQEWSIGDGSSVNTYPYNSTEEAVAALKQYMDSSGRKRNRPNWK